MADTERTLAVLFGPHGPRLRSDIEARLVSAGFTVLAETECVGEELEEAGLDLGDAPPTGPDDVHVALVLERRAAVAVWKDLVGDGAAALNKTSLRASFPELRTHGSPTASAAAMSIATLFPALSNGASHSPVASNASLCPPPARAPAHVPFALSNLAHVAPPVPATKHLSPTVERALLKLEMEEEKDKKRLSSGSSTVDGSPSDPAAERRVFVYHSRDTTREFGHEGTDSAPSDADSYLEQEHFEETDEDDLEAPSAPRPATTRRTSTSVSEPRLTKAAALRLGIVLPPRPRPASRTASRTDDASSATGSSAGSHAPPHVGAAVPVPKSLAAPTIVPRGTKASQLRSAGEDAPLPPLPTKSVRRASLSTAERSALPGFENTPGHKRRASIQVASTAPPKVQPRLSRAAMIRAGLDVPPTAARHTDSSLGGAAHGGDGDGDDDDDATPTKAPRVAVKSIAPPLFAPRPTKASSLRSAGVESPASMARGRSLNRLEDLVEDLEPPAPAPAMLRAHTIAGPADTDVTPRAHRRDSTQPVVRLTKAALLRSGVELEMPALSRHTTDGSTSTTFEGVAGHKRRESIQVASTAKPKIEPRMSRATLLRAGMDVESSAMRRASTAPVPMDYDGVPGHRRRESNQVASSRPPVIAPRLNRSTALRTGGEPSPSPFLTLTRSASADSSTAHLLAVPRAASALSYVSSAASGSHTGGGGGGGTTPATRRRSSIVRRSNKSAELRQAKKEAEHQAAAAALKLGPSSRHSGRRPATAQGILASSAVANGGGSPRNSVVLAAAAAAGNSHPEQRTVSVASMTSDPRSDTTHKDGYVAAVQGGLR